jgi:hypothetical protein
MRRPFGSMGASVAQPAVPLDSLAMDADLLFALRALVDQHRLRIVARAAARPVDVETLAAELRQPVASVRRHVQALVQAGLLEERPDPGLGSPQAYGARLDRVGMLGRALAALEREADPVAADPAGAWPHDGEPLAETLARLGLTPDERRILRSFLVDGRLVSIPVGRARRDVILRFLLERVFSEDRRYPEKEVNQRLALFHPDVAALRRYLVDEGYVDRDGGLYWRRTLGA